ncbi:uncharacterized protein E5676_scaffold255G006000 [Cucumis melo var. makuwa]|uniref:Uncharacterized protein n=1 Tax=Cucumis melo var. makuwa TaxID=1194695 RepID=A0A5D3CNS5_CUCMM|nr:uncharacterized protein E5676_scaffold255G006000 [Cucumis melo var. makuwa]
MMAALSSLQNFIHFPTSFSISSNSRNLNAAASFHTTINNNSYLPPQPLSTKRRRRPSLCVQCHGGGSFSMKNQDDNDDNDEDPLETINKVYKSIKKKDVIDLANVIADQRPDIMDSIPFLGTSLVINFINRH